MWQAAQAARGRRSGGARAQRVRAQLRARDGLLLVAEDGSRPVGMLLAVLARADDGAGPVVPGLLHLSMLSVAPDVSPAEVGAALLRGLTDRYPRVQVWAVADDGPVLALYAAAGFRPSGREQELAAGRVVHLER